MKISADDHLLKFHPENLHDLVILGKLSIIIPEFGYKLSSPGFMEEMKTKDDLIALKKDIQNTEGSVSLNHLLDFLLI